MVATSSVTLGTNISSGAVADLLAEGNSSIVYAAVIDSYNYFGTVEQSVGTIGIVRSATGVPRLGAVDPALWTRGADTVDSLRIARVGDLNGDGLLDVGLETTYFQYGTVGGEYIDTVFTQVIQRPGGVFATADTHGGFFGPVFDGYEPSGGTDMRIPLFTVADLRRNGRLDLLTLVYHGSPYDTDLASPTLVGYASTAVWKPPEIVGTFATTMSVSATVRFADLARGASVAHVRCYKDSNGNGILDGTDELLGTADAASYSDYPDHPTSIWEIGFASPVARLTTLILQAEDSTGALGSAVGVTVFYPG